MEQYDFLPDLPVDPTLAVQKLQAHIEDPARKLALLPGANNKDAEGHIIPSGDFDPIGSHGLPPRNGKPVSKFSYPVECIKSIPRKKAVRRGPRPGKKRKVTSLT